MEPIRIQKIIDYIEYNLETDISYDSIASMMATSEADLQRSFKMITGLTISEYIRYRRLTKAALEIKESDNTILDIALKYGYQTAESFSKAFRQFHGCTPTDARKSAQAIRYFNPITIKLAKRGGNIIDNESYYHEEIDSITAFYDVCDEQNRLTKDKHSYIEYLVTMHYLNKVIPKNSRILDCCAGTGIYSFELAKSHQVVASDLSLKNVELMKKLQSQNPILHGIYQLDACNMSIFEDESFDVVLCMGALYHLFDETERNNVIRECIRVCKKNGILVFAYLNKWGSFINGLVNNLKSLDLLYSEFDSGNNENIFYRTTPSKMDEICHSFQLECLYNIGVDHLAYLSKERIDSMNDEDHKIFMQYQMKAAEDPDIQGVSLHGLWIGKIREN